MVKINRLEIENVKRVKAVRLSPSAKGLTIIGGKNGQGKTSVLDAIAWALGGKKFEPTKAHREGSMTDPKLHIELSNGLIVERGGKNGTLKVIDPNGAKGGQKLLDAFVDELALDLPKFMQASDTEKGKILLQIIGVGDKLAEMDREEATLYNRRTEIGRIAEQKSKFAAEMTYYPDVPKEPVSASDLIQQQQEILKKNAENQRLRENAKSLQAELDAAVVAWTQAQRALEDAKAKCDELTKKVKIAQKDAEDLHDESTEELEQNIADVDALNVKIRANLDREKAELDAETYSKQYDSLTQDIESIRESRKALLDSAELPLPELSVKEGKLLYKGQQWDGMSGAERLRVATAIVRKLKPECGFVLMDKLEQMDQDTLAEFGAWLEAEGLQVIATRVSTGGECSIIIEDGYVLGGEKEAPTPQKTEWKAGSF